MSSGPRLEMRDTNPTSRTAGVDELFGSQAGARPQIRKVTLRGARSDAYRLGRVGNGSARRDIRREDVDLASGRRSRGRPAEISVPHTSPPRRGEPLIAALDGHLVGCYRASTTCRARHNPPHTHSPAFGRGDRQGRSLARLVPGLERVPMPLSRRGVRALQGASQRSETAAR
jgi:hypothetical protein